MATLSQTQLDTINNASDAANNTVNNTAVMNADALSQNQQSPNLPVTSPTTIPSVSALDINQYLTPTTSKTDQSNIDNLSNASGSIFEQLFNAQESQATQGARQTKLEEQAGIPKLTTELSDIQNQITQKTLDARRELQNIQNAAGLTAAQKNARLSEIGRKQSAELADLEVVRAARSNSLNAIQSIIDRKVERQFADEDARINNLKFIYGEVKGDLTKAQDRQYQEMITKEQRGFELAKDQYQQLENAKAEMVKNASISGAPSSVISSIMATTDKDKLYSTPGFSQYLTSPIDKLDMQLKKAQLSESNYNLKKLMQESGISTGLTADQKKQILGNKNAQQAASRIGVIKAVELYKQKVNDLLGDGWIGAPTGTQKAALDAMLNTTVGSALNVAQGQGAMGDKEAARMLGGLKSHKLTSPQRIISAADGIISAQDTLYKNDLSFVESAIPGASSSYQLFADYAQSKNDPLLINNSNNPANNPLNLNL